MSSRAGLGVACVAIGLVVRLLATFLLVHFGGFTWKEKLFIAVAWTPKATVQVGVEETVPRVVMVHLPNDVFQEPI